MGKKQQSQREILPDPYEDEQRTSWRGWREELPNLIEWAKQPKVAGEGEADDLWREELLSTGKFAEELDRQNISKQEKLVRIDEFFEQLHQRNADKHARLERKQKYADEREHLDWIRNNIKQGIKKPRLGRILEGQVEILNSISDRLLDALLTYEEMRLWLQTKPDLAAELNVDLSQEVEPDDLRYMLESALFVGTFFPTGTAAGWVKWRKKIRTAPAREGKSSVTQRKNKKIADLVKEYRDRRPKWGRQDVAHYIAIELKNPKTGKPLNAGAVQRSRAFKKAWEAWTSEPLSAPTPK
jgi:hypothetical protein